MLHYIDYNNLAHSSDVGEMTHDMTRNNRASVFMLLVVFKLSCNAAK